MTENIAMKNMELDSGMLERISGGADLYHDMNNFVPLKVVNVIHWDPTACLTLRRTPGGEIIPGDGWQNGDTILINKKVNENGWLYACRDGVYGYVNGNYVAR